QGRRTAGVCCLLRPAERKAEEIPSRPAARSGSRCGGCLDTRIGETLMSVTVQEILRELAAFAPPELACSWDNVGLLVDAGRPVTKVLTALDITADVVREAAAEGCELIVSHHPVIFDP